MLMYNRMDLSLGVDELISEAVLNIYPREEFGIKIFMRRVIS